METIEALTLEKYNAVLALCKRSKAYYRHVFSGTKNHGKYLKIVTRKGMYFTPQEVEIINNYIFNITGNRFKMTHNLKKGSLTITLY